MGSDAILINTARGGLVDETALIDALQSGQLAGAGLDCQASEPPVGVSAQLVGLDSVVATPHSGSLTITARIRMAQMAARSIVDVLQGRVPEQVVNREVLEKLGARQVRAALIVSGGASLSEGVEAFVDRWMALPMWDSLRTAMGPEGWARSRDQRLRGTATGYANSLRGA